jgi:hypothetical protein
MLSEVVRDIADKIDRGDVSALEFELLPLAACPPGYAIHKITFQVRRSS